MKKTTLLVVLKCTVILYFAACTSINKYTTDVSATPHITSGTWKVNLFIKQQNDVTTDFSGYTLKFDPNGKLTASKGSQEVTGNWAEDDISKKLTISIDTNDPVLEKLSDYWTISSISNEGLSFQNAKDPAGGWLQITDL